jgi:hypothetical protein
MVLTLFISEDKRDEFAGTAWPFDSLLEHTNQGASAQTSMGLSPEAHPSHPALLRPCLLQLAARQGRREGRVEPWVGVGTQLAGVQL